MTTTGTIEHRREPRFRHPVPVRIGNLSLTSTNVSLHGMQIACPVMRFTGLAPDVRRGQLDARVTLPGSAPFGAMLSVRYFSQNGDEMLIGVEMAVAELGANAQWAAFIGTISSANQAKEGRPAR